MSAILQSSSAGPGPSSVWGGIKRVGQAAVGAATNWAVGQIGSGAPRASSPPSIPVPSMPGPGGAQMGMGGIGMIGRAAGAAGAVVGRIAGSKKVRAVVGGVVGWWLVDKVTGALLGPTTAPRRSMNVLNVRALRRADRRMDGFIRVVRKVASGQGYTLQRRGSGKCAPKRKRCK